MIEATVCRAIRNGLLLEVVYANCWRVIAEPHVLGRSAAGHDILLCWQVEPIVRAGISPWQFFNLHHVTGLQVLQKFQLPEGGRNTPLDEFSSIYVSSASIPQGGV